MPKFLITLVPMPAEQVKTVCSSVLNASVGSGLKMDSAYVDVAASQPICIWDAPDRKSVEALFAKAGQKPESIREVMAYHA
jgi:hypothetical protein